MPLNVLDLTPIAMAQMMEELAVNFGNKKDLRKRSDQWYDHFQRYPETVVRRVISRLLSEDTKYWPTLGHAMAVARELAPEFVSDTKSPRAGYAAWERDPWGKIKNLDHAPMLCTSDPCPVCGSVIQFSSRGAVIVHDRQRHEEARLPYSNIGRKEWFSMEPPVYPEPKKRLKTPEPPAAPLGDVVAEVAP